MEEMKPIVNQQKQREDPRKLARILFYVWSGVTGIMWCYFMMLTGVRTHSIMRTAQAHQEKYRDGLEPIPYTMRSMLVLQFLFSSFGVLSCGLLAFGIRKNRRGFMLPWLVLSLIVMAWVSVNQVLDVMYGLTTTEKFYFIITIDILCVLPWTLIALYYDTMGRKRPTLPALRC